MSDLRARLIALGDDAEYDNTHRSVVALAAARMALEDAQHECERMAEGSFVGAVCANRIRALAAGLDDGREHG